MTLEQELNERVLRTMIGFAVKSGKIVFGLDNIVDCRKRISLIIVDDDISPRSFAALKIASMERNIQLLPIPQKLADIVQKNNCKAIAILDKNLSDNIIKNAGNGGGNLIV